MLFTSGPYFPTSDQCVQTSVWYQPSALTLVTHNSGGAGDLCNPRHFRSSPVSHNARLLPLTTLIMAAHGMGEAASGANANEDKDD